MRDVHLEGLFEFGLVQHRVGRAGGFGREFRRMAGDDAAFVVSRGRGDLRREVVPRAHALVGEVVHALIARIAPVSYTHLTLPTTICECRSRWSPYH